MLEYLTFFREVSFKDTQFKPEVKIQNLSFAPFITQTAKDGFKSFLTALNKSGYAKEAKFYEQNVGADGIDAKSTRTNLTLPRVQTGSISSKQPRFRDFIRHLARHTQRRQSRRYPPHSLHRRRQKLPLLPPPPRSLQKPGYGFG